MKSFYQEMITSKSWRLLQELRKKSDFILIGGWAVYLYTHALKSKDIDIIVDYEVLSKFKKEYELFKNERLKKYEIKQQGIDIDIYLPYFSNIGLPVEEIIKYKDQKETFGLPQKEVLFITKQKAYLERKGTIKGEKDKIDIISLLFLDDFNFNLYKNVLQEQQLVVYKNILKEILDETYEIKELGCNRHFFAKKKKEVLNHLL